LALLGRRLTEEDGFGFLMEDARLMEEDGFLGRFVF